MNKLVKKYRLQGKDKGHTTQLIKSLVFSLVRSEKVKTTPTKAKIIKSQFDRLVTHYKKGGAGGMNKVKSFFNSNDLSYVKFEKLVKEKLGDRNSGYTSLVKTLPRKGDNADQTIISIVGYEKKARKSRVEKLLEKRKVTDEKKSVRGRVSKAVKKITNNEESKN